MSLSARQSHFNRGSFYRSPYLERRSNCKQEDTTSSAHHSMLPPFNYPQLGEKCHQTSSTRFCLRVAGGSRCISTFGTLRAIPNGPRISFRPFSGQEPSMAHLLASFRTRKRTLPPPLNFASFKAHICVRTSPCNSKPPMRRSPCIWPETGAQSHLDQKAGSLIVSERPVQVAIRLMRGHSVEDIRSDDEDESQPQGPLGRGSPRLPSIGFLMAEATGDYWVGPVLKRELFLCLESSYFGSPSSCVP